MSLESILRPVLLLLSMLAAFAMTPATAQESGDKAAIQSVISRQMEAFKRDDAAGAYAFAAPGIKTLFPSPDGFLAMVRNKYAPVYRPKSIAFGALKATEQGLTQTVAIIDAGGQAWTALYVLAKGPEGQWQITGCFLIKAVETNARAGSSLFEFDQRA
jgi:hypothetical protein